MDLSSPKIIIVDLDGTLSINLHRQYLVTGQNSASPKWREFFLASELDPPNTPIITITNKLKDTGYFIHIFSGRSDIVYDMTTRWLETHKVKYDKLTMRENGDTTRDDLLKKRWLLEFYPNFEDDVLLVIDDRELVVKMWRGIGLVCLQADWGKF